MKKEERRSIDPITDGLFFIGLVLVIAGIYLLTGLAWTFLLVGVALVVVSILRLTAKSL